MRASAALRLDALDTACMEAERALLDELRLVYPQDTVVMVRCQSNHPRASQATVIGYHPRDRCGELRVRLSGGHETTVHYTAIVE